MSDAIHDELQPVLVRWTMGGAAAALAPDGMRGELGDDPDEAELRLLVLAGQALGTLVVPEPAGGLEGLPDLPQLPLPTMPDRLRPIAARVLGRNEEWLRTGVLRLVETRGYVVHPSDWMPTKTGFVPAIYAPWQDWLSGMAADGPANAADLAARWDDYGPAGRRMLLAGMRDADPDAALALISDKVSMQPAEQRLWMVEALSRGLAERDRTFLEGLSADRAPTVRAAATRLLRRLGGNAGTVGDDVLRDVTDFIRVEDRGLLRRHRVITLSPARNTTQSMLRSQALAAMDPRQLALALGIEDVELAGMWPWGQDGTLDVQFADVLLGTGTDEVVRSLEKAIADGAWIQLWATATGTDRVTRETLALLAQRAYAEAQHLASLASMLPVTGAVDDYKASPGYRSLVLQLRKDEGVKGVTGLHELLALGLMVTSRAAGEILDQLGRVGMPSADPRLDTLRLSAAL